MADDTDVPDWPSPGDPDDLFETVVERGELLASRRRTVLACGLVAALLVASAGYAMGRSGAVDLREDRAVEVADATVPYFSCPGLTQIGELHRGDRVLVTGRDTSGRWAEIRSPMGLAERAWVRLALLDLDDQTPLLVRDCIDPVTGEIAPPPTEPEETTTTSTEPEETTTTTSEPEETTTTSTEPEETTTTTTVPETTTRPPTTTTALPAPIVGQVDRNPAVIFEQAPDSCDGPVASSVSVSVQDATSATLLWSVAGNSGQRPMSLAGGRATGTVGPFNQNTVVPPATNVQVQVTIQVTGPGGTVERATTITVRDCA